jgi:hypothetical protein
MMEHEVIELEAEAWLRRAGRLRDASRLKFDPSEREVLTALAEDCEAIARRISSRRAATTAKDDTSILTCELPVSISVGCYRSVT